MYFEIMYNLLLCEIYLPSATGAELAKARHNAKRQTVRMVVLLRFPQIAAVQWRPAGSDDDLSHDFRVYMESSSHCCHVRTTGGKTKYVVANFKD